MDGCAARGRRGGVCMDLHHESGGVYIRQSIRAHITCQRQVPSLVSAALFSCTHVSGVRVSCVPCVLSAGWKEAATCVPSVQQWVRVHWRHYQYLRACPAAACWETCVCGELCVSVPCLSIKGSVCRWGPVSDWCPVLRRLQPDFVQCRVWLRVGSLVWCRQRTVLCGTQRPRVVNDRQTAFEWQECVVPVVTCVWVNCGILQDKQRSGAHRTVPVSIHRHTDQDRRSTPYFRCAAAHSARRT